MDTKEVPIICIDSGDEEEILGYNSGILPPELTKKRINEAFPSPHHIKATSPSSSTITAASASSDSGNEKDTILSNNENHTSHTNNTDTVGKIFVSKNIFRTPEKRNGQSSTPIKSLNNVLNTSQNISPYKIVCKQQASKIKIPSNQVTKLVVTQPVQGRLVDSCISTDTQKIQKNQKVTTGPKSIIEKNKKVLIFDFPTKRVIQKQKVFVRDNSGISGESQESGAQIQPKDPLYIPQQGKTPSVGKKGATTPSNKIDKKTNRNVLSGKCEICLDPNKPSTSSHNCKVQREKTNKKPGNTEHLIVKNYAVQNIATNLTKGWRTKIESQMSATNNRSKILKTSTPQGNTASCRNVFIKNSAWELLETEFRGFNEREEEISKYCSECLSKIVQDLSKKQEHNYSQKSLFFLLKFKVNEVNTEHCGTNKRKAEVPVPYKYPPTKKCKIVLRRNDLIERKVKQLMLQEKLNSYTLEHLTFSPEDTNKPLIILNRQNFNILRINETLTKYSNVLYVKESAEQFSEELLGNSNTVKHIERGGIRVVTPDTLKNFMCDHFLRADV